MPFVRLDTTTRIFYAIYSGQDEKLDASKPTVLLLHPRFFDHEMLATQYTDPQLRDNYNLITIDLHYHGQSEVPVDDLPFDYGKIVNDVFRVMDSLDIPYFHLFGSSLGSLIAVRMAVAQSHRIQSLTLCSILPPEETEENKDQFRSTFELSTHKDEDDDKGRMPREMVVAGQWLYFGKWTPPDLVRFQATSKFTPANKQLMKKAYSALLDRKPFPKSEWQKITMPVLMIHGGADYQYPLEVGRITYDLIPATTPKSFHTIDDAPHIISWTHPEVVNKLLADFLRDQPFV